MPLSKDQERRKIQPKHHNNSKRNDENERFEKLLDKLEEMTTKGRLKDIAYHFTSKKEVVKVNLLAGVARGVGLTIGTAIFIGIFIFVLYQIASLPVIGEYIANLVDVIEANREQTTIYRGDSTWTG
ncbi:DUF5665 domain-containing protein [Bacillus shivajii]|uniref:DUF5665 domain-containing protein n=1 Tax=Bacillus shivajii TaxID=1983719 RepID=UPI001CF938B9|nr:DUF5665 domain-containing protein [Bacillus shivajii]UCZ53827.1 DUF5665 domain-containing protein [Bacillus shivajii]